MSFATAALAATLAPAAADIGPSVGALRAPLSGRPPAHRPPSSALLFAETGDEAINVYDLHNPLKKGPITKITSDLVGLQYGIDADASGNLYVVNDDFLSNLKEYVTVFAPPYNGSPTILNGVLFPIGIAVDKQGNVYVGSCGSNCGSPAGIYVYPPGATTPASEITSPLLQSIAALALDSAGNLYVANWNPATLGGNILEMPAGTTTLHDMKLKGVGMPWGVTVDPAGDIYVSSAPCATYVLGFKAGKTVASSLIDTLPTGYSPEELAFGSDGNLYVPMLVGNGNAGSEILGFHGTKQFEQIPEPDQFVFGVATFPNPILGGSAR